MKTFYGHHEIIRHSVICHEFLDGSPHQAQTLVFPFNFQVPGFCPESCDMTFGFEDAEAAIRYELVASVTPLNDEDWAIKDQGVSSLRTSKKVRLFKPFVPSMPTNKTLKMDRAIGGFCCCGQTPYSANVSFDKDQYSPGETANVTVDLDNSQCAKDVTDFKLRLYQYVKIWGLTKK